MVQTCHSHMIHEKQIEQNKKNIEDIQDKMVEIEKNTALDAQRFTLILENLSRLPDAIDSIKDSLVTMQMEIKNANDKTDSLKEKIEKLNNKVCQIDEEGSFNIRQAIKDHFVLAIVFVAGFSIYASTVLFPYFQSIMR